MIFFLNFNFIFFYNKKKDNSQTPLSGDEFDRQQRTSAQRSSAARRNNNNSDLYKDDDEDEESTERVYHFTNDLSNVEANNLHRAHHQQAYYYENHGIQNRHQSLANDKPPEYKELFPMQPIAQQHSVIETNSNNNSVNNSSIRLPNDPAVAAQTNSNNSPINNNNANKLV